MTDHARRLANVSDTKRLSAHGDPLNMSPEYVENPAENRHIEVVPREISEQWVVE